MSELIRSIVAGIGDIDDPDPHLEPAVQLAETLGATLHLVHAFPGPDPILSPRDAQAGSESEGLRRLRSEVLSRLQASTPRASGRNQVVYHAVPGSASEAILDVAEREGAELVIVGATQRGALASLILGTTAQRVLRASPVPVLVNRPTGQSRPQRVLLTTDLSKLSAGVHERGLALVTTLWGAAGIEVRSLFVAGDDLLLPPPLQQIPMRERAEERLEMFLSRVSSGELAVKGKVRLGLSAREILSEAEEWSAHLLVLGTHGRTGTSRFLIGSVAETVLRKASCDVLLIPAATFGSAAAVNERIA